MKIGLAADHGGRELKDFLKARLEESGHDVKDFGAYEPAPDDDYPDYVVPMAQAVASGECGRGIAVCASGVGASVAANKIPGARAALVVDAFSARQGVEDDDMNIICLGGSVVGYSLARDLVDIFLRARFRAEERFVRRLSKITRLEER